MNDGACDIRGRLWAGTMSLDGDTRTAALYRLDPDLRLTRVLSCISVSNGLGWSPGGTLMYHVDTPRRRVDVFEFDPVDGGLGRRRAAIDVPLECGRPDGLAVDAEGGIWVAIWGGGAVHRYNAEGRLDERVELPVSQVTSCCFGGADLDTLYVTSASRGTSGEPLAGALFACRPGLRGLPATPFAG
jgi:sugar lactone lactonase YvrE